MRGRKGRKRETGEKEEEIICNGKNKALQLN